MARITVEDCLDRVDNRFQLIHLAAKRVRQLKKGAEPTVVCKNKDIVVALREIASGNVFRTRKGKAHDRIEAPEESASLSVLEEGSLDEELKELQGQEMDWSRGVEEVLESDMSEDNQFEDAPGLEMDESEEDVKEK